MVPAHVRNVVPGMDGLKQFNRLANKQVLLLVNVFAWL
jgi:hypothetical protein